MPAKPRRTDYVPLDDLVPEPGNPKGHEIDGVIRAIKRHGFMDAPILDGRTNRLVAGHGRREALLMMRDSGEDPPDGITLSPRGWLVPVQVGWASRSDAAAHAASIGLNKWTMGGGFADDQLLTWLEEINSVDPEMITDAGISTDELTELLADIGGGGGGGSGPPDGFPGFDDDLEVQYECPRCAYGWNGNPKPGVSGIAEAGGERVNWQDETQTEQTPSSAAG